ncbi:UDPGT domain-containing protein, partial [Cephalotus follicularis]
MENKGYKAHVLTVPYPSQGHINPMLQFSKRLAFKHLKVTLAITHFISNSMRPKPSSSIQFDTISDGYDEGGFAQADSIRAYLTRLQADGSKTLSELIIKYKNNGDPIDCIVYDAFLPWALDVAKKFGIFGAPFFTQSCAVNYIYYYAHHGLLTLPITSTTVSIPGLPLLELQDMPSMIGVAGSYPAYLEMVLNQFSNTDKASVVLVNSFYKLEEVVKWMASLWPIKNIGPVIPSMYLDKRLEDDKDYGLSLFKPNIDGCLKWLDAREVGSVIYISFGSMAALVEEQLEEIAWGLKRSNYFFLWVVRESEVKKLPSNLLEEISDKGLIVNWSPQLQVLAHKAVGCFMTHCGWNSTLEALSLGMPMVGIPQWTDQPTNAKFVADVWQTGVRVKANEKGMVTREEIEKCVREVMEGERADEMRRNSDKWKKLAKEAVEEGGSSDNNIEEFVAKL